MRAIIHISRIVAAASAARKDLAIESPSFFKSDIPARIDLNFSFTRFFLAACRLPPLFPCDASSPILVHNAVKSISVTGAGRLRRTKNNR